MENNKYLYCPIRGQLNITEKDNKTIFTEEYNRIELVKFLLNKGYKKELFGFEKIILKYGNAGRNTLKADLVIYKSEENKDVDNILIVAEVKKYIKDKNKAIEYQLKPAFKNLMHCLYAIYWDYENRILYKKDNENTISEISILKLPLFGQIFNNNLIKYDDLIEVEHPLLILYNLEQKIHNLGGTNKNFRYKEIFKLLLHKYFDENKNKNKDYLEFQILNKDKTKDRIQKLYIDALKYYSTNSPIELEKSIELDENILIECIKIMQNISLVKTSQLVLQDFFMYFAPTFLRKELDQYYTPQELVNFITNMIELDETKTFVDPCGGSGDFLVGTIKKGMEHNITNIKNNAFYFDISKDAVNIASLNMILNGDGRTNIKCIDSIEESSYKNDYFDICITNPPFGKNTIWSGNDSKMKEYEIAKYNNTYVNMELGVLFIERCINLLKDNGILSIVLPNGYLTNPTHKYIREYLLNVGRIIGVVSLPEDVFKKSDASGFTDILFFQKVGNIDKNYKIFSGVANKIGFEQSKKSTPKIYKMTDDGYYILENNKKVIDNDLDNMVKEFKQFCYDENILGMEKKNYNINYSSFFKDDILKNDNLILSARRHHDNYKNIINNILNNSNMTLNSIKANITNKKDCNIIKTNSYIYLDTGELFNGQYRRTNILKGWELPSRAKLSVKKYDILISKTKGCFNKFCIIVEDNNNLIATNGFYRIRIDSENERLNFFAFLFTNEYRLQMESLTTGSILADVKEWDLFNNLYIPKVSDLSNIKNLINGFESLTKI